MKSEDSLIQEGLNQQEAKVVVFLARRKEASVKMLAKTIMLSAQQCQMMLDRMVNRGILNRKKMRDGYVFSLSSLFDEILRKEEHRGAGRPYMPPFISSKISRITKPAPE